MNYRVICSTVENGNMSFRYGNEKEVIKNRTSFFKSQNIKNKVNIKVINENKIVFLKNNSCEQISADSVVTNQPNVLLYICFGDCIPMILYDKKQKIISLTHLGWQSVFSNLQQEIVRYFLEILKSNIDDLEVVLGPSIKKDSYIFKNPIQSTMKEWKAYLEKINDEEYKIDLNKFVFDSLLKINVKNIKNSEIDTATNPNFFSHYRYTYITQDKEEGRFIYGVILEAEKSTFY